MDLSAARLYGIIDLGYVREEDCKRVASEMIEGGVDIVQLRAKNLPVFDFARIAATLAPIFAKAKLPFILNDHPELVPQTGASGAHVGQDDLSVAEARKLAGPSAIIGKSTHSLDQAIAGAAEADYIGFGPLFATPTKPDYRPIGLSDIRAIHESTSTPIFCIGGIKLENLPTVVAAGARRVVIVSGLLQAPDLADYARQVRSVMGES